MLKKLCITHGEAKQQEISGEQLGAGRVVPGCFFPVHGPVLGDLRLEVRGGRCEDLDLLTSYLCLETDEKSEIPYKTIMG